MRGGVYEIRNTLTGDRYVGSAMNFARRQRNHFSLLRSGRHHSIHLQRAYEKYGESALNFKALAVCDGEYALALEQRMLDAGWGAYNVARDSSAPMRGRTHSAEVCDKIRTARLGTPHTHETLQKMRAVWQNPTFRARQSAARKGKPKSPAHRAKLAELLKKARAARGTPWAS